MTLRLTLTLLLLASRAPGEPPPTYPTPPRTGGELPMVGHTEQDGPAVDVDAFELAEGREGKLVRRLQPKGPQVPLERLEGIGSVAPKSLYGWAGPRVYRSYDDGRSWSVEAVADEPIEVLAFLTRETGLARTKSGTMLSRTKGEKAWGASPSPELDAYDLRVATGSGAERLDPLRCLATAETGFLHVRFEVKGCFGGSARSLRISWNGARSGLSTRDEGSRRSEKDAGQPAVEWELSAEDARAAREVFASLAHGRERDPGFGSTDHTEVTLAWACDGDPTHEARFSSSACDAFDESPGAKAEPVVDGHERACALYRAAVALANGPAEKSPHP
jgi:hypothetical protein